MRKITFIGVTHPEGDYSFKKLIKNILLARFKNLYSPQNQKWVIKNLTTIWFLYLNYRCNLTEVGLNQILCPVTRMRQRETVAYMPVLDTEDLLKVIPIAV